MAATTMELLRSLTAAVFEAEVAYHVPHELLVAIQTHSQLDHHEAAQAAGAKCPPGCPGGCDGVADDNRSGRNGRPAQDWQLARDKGQA